jgi:hypothetical protein
MKQFIKNNFATIVLVLALLSLLKSCGDSRELQKLRKEVEVVKEQSASKEEIELLQNKVMFEFLIYEDDIDNKKASLSDIKNKIDELEKKQNAK